MFVSHQSFFLLFKKEIWHSACTRPRKRYANCLRPSVSAAGPRCGSPEREVFTLREGASKTLPALLRTPTTRGTAASSAWEPAAPRRCHPQRSAAGPRFRGIPRSPGPSPPGLAGPPEAPRAGAAPRSTARCGAAGPPLSAARGGRASRPLPFRTHPRTPRTDTHRMCGHTRTQPALTHTRA